MFICIYLFTLLFKKLTELLKLNDSQISAHLLNDLEYHQLHTFLTQFRTCVYILEFSAYGLLDIYTMIYHNDISCCFGSSLRLESLSLYLTLQSLHCICMDYKSNIILRAFRIIFKRSLHIWVK